MTNTVFLAGSTGAIGRRLLPMLIDARFKVYGTTRRAERIDDLKKAGAIPVHIDVFERDALAEALVAITPDIVVHQLTDLPFGLEPEKMQEGRIRNARLREIGTKNLVDAAIAARTSRMISQSVAWVYEPSTEVITEAFPLQDSATAIRTLEALTLNTPGIAGTVLRYGLLYGPDTGFSSPSGPVSLHVDDAARAALLALQKQATGVFNIVEDGGPVSNEKAGLELGWRPTRS